MPENMAEMVIGGMEALTYAPPSPPLGAGSKVTATDLTSKLFYAIMLVAVAVFAWRKQDRILAKLGIKRKPHIPAALRPDKMKSGKFMKVPNQQPMSNVDEEDEEDEDYGEDEQQDEEYDDLEMGEEGDEGAEGYGEEGEDGDEDEEEYDEMGQLRNEEDATAADEARFPSRGFAPRVLRGGRGRGCRDMDAESSATFDFGGGGGQKDDDAESDVIGPDDSVSNIGHRPCVLRQAKKLSQVGQLGSMGMGPLARIDDSMSMIWTRRNEPQRAAAAGDQGIMRLGELDCGHTRDLGATLKQRGGIQIGSAETQDPVCAPEDPDAEKGPARRMKASKRLPKQPSPKQEEKKPKQRSRRTPAQEQEEEADMPEGDEAACGIPFGQPEAEEGGGLCGKPVARDAAESVLTFAQGLPEPFEARAAPRRRQPIVARKPPPDAESAVTFACEGGADHEDEAAPEESYEEERQCDGESAVTFTAPNHGGLVLGMSAPQPAPGKAERGRGRGRGCRVPVPQPTPAAKVPTRGRAPAAPHPNALLQPAEEPGEENEDEIGGADASDAGAGDDVFTMVALSREPPRMGRLAGGGKIQNGKWVTAAELRAQADPPSGIKRI
tara:strand:- start:1585 stop:3411 length:1827 start_codon:yes stop_codon:yes gene_type:complete